MPNCCSALHVITAPCHLPLSCALQQFNNTNHNFEVRLERDSHIEQVPEDEETAIIPRIQYNVSIHIIGC
jgi:hypothetical protein